MLHKRTCNVYLNRKHTNSSAVSTKHRVWPNLYK